MSTGLKKIIRVGFFSNQSSNWMGGINYFKNLFIAMSKVDNPQIKPFILYPKDNRAKILLDYAEVIKLSKGLKYILDKLMFKLKRQKFKKEKYLYSKVAVDVISHSHVMSSDKPIISWIPDFQHLHLPEMFNEDEIRDRNTNFHNYAQSSTIVIMSSQDALNDYKKFTPEHAHKGRVLHFVSILDDEVYEKTDEIKNEIIKKFDLPEKYFYIPNQFWKHKNHKVVFEAIGVLKQQGLEINVVFTGNTADYRHSDYFNELMNYAREKNIENNIKILGLVDLIEVYYLMRNCISIINPSFFEGWSSTVEEAKSLGKNIILSNLSVHIEQNPPMGIFFDPHNPNELANILKEKWNTRSSSPDYELEKSAKEQLGRRIQEFGTEYQQIVLEALEI